MPSLDARLAELQQKASALAEESVKLAKNQRDDHDEIVVFRDLFRRVKLLEDAQDDDRHAVRDWVKQIVMALVGAGLGVFGSWLLLHK